MECFSSERRDGDCRLNPKPFQARDPRSDPSISMRVTFCVACQRLDEHKVRWQVRTDKVVAVVRGGVDG